MTLWHKSLSKRWRDFPRFQQILMICNELNRAKNNLNYPKEYSNCIERALELCDLCTDDDQWNDNRLYELRRARTVLAEIYYSKLQPNTKPIMNAILSLDSESWKKLNSRSKVVTSNL
jgi:hypothetical protein